MRRILLQVALMVLALAAAPGVAQARTSVHVGLGFGFWGPGYYYPPPYYAYPYPYYYPPPVVYAPAPTYAPAPAAYGAPPPDAVTLREGRDSQGNYCREYQTTLTVNGQPVPSYGTACLRPDGRWQIIN
ncbi:MAG: hypothetical protein HYR63_15270 [Proteobacteria bacterium]|nr:hypothetical protein [Pseudomonadota bacterium]